MIVFKRLKLCKDDNILELFLQVCRGAYHLLKSTELFHNGIFGWENQFQSPKFVTSD